MFIPYYSDVGFYDIGTCCPTEGCFSCLRCGFGSRHGEGFVYSVLNVCLLPSKQILHYGYSKIYNGDSENRLRLNSRYQCPTFGKCLDMHLTMLHQHIFYRISHCICLFPTTLMMDFMLFMPTIQPSAVLAVAIAAFAVGMLKDLFIYRDS